MGDNIYLSWADNYTLGIKGTYIFQAIAILKWEEERTREEEIKLKRCFPKFLISAAPFRRNVAILGPNPLNLVVIPIKFFFYGI